MDSDDSLRDRTAVVTGGYGVLGGCMADGLAGVGARVAVLGRRREAAEAKAAEMRDNGFEAMALSADVTNEREVAAARDELVAAWGPPDILINAAGGNVQRSRNDDRPVFEVPLDAFDEVVRLNLHGTVIPTQLFGEAMAGAGRGCIINVSSMAAGAAISGVLGYSVAKAAIDSFTRWMAVDLARRHGPGMRVNAISPGFFVADQNRGALLKPDGSHTDRAKAILAHTPMGRFGAPDELVGVIRWLCSDSAAFVTGAVIPVDGGFSAFSGV